MTAPDNTPSAASDSTMDGSHGGSYSFDPATGVTTLVQRTAQATVSRKAPLVDAAGNPVAEAASAADAAAQDTQPGAA